MSKKEDTNRKSLILTDTIVEELYDYQIDKVERIVRDMQTLNKASLIRYPEYFIVLVNCSNVDESKYWVNSRSDT